MGISECFYISFLYVATKFSLQDPTKIDNLISSEIPPVTSPHLRELVLKYIIHAPCSDNPDSRYMREGRCSKNFPKPFRSETDSIEGDNYKRYRSRSTEEGGESGLRTKKSGALGIHKIAIDNSWVVPYTSDFLRKFRTRMKVENCISRFG